MSRGVALLSFAATYALGQAAVGTPTFEVASVKPASAQANGRIALLGGPGTLDRGRIDYQNVTLKMMLMRAYEVEADQVSGPSSIEASHYDVQARFPPDTTREQFDLMLANLLAERFGLIFHREKKDFLVYELQVAKGGSKLKKSVGDALPAIGSSGRGGPVDKDGFPVPPAHQTAQIGGGGIAKMAGNQITAAVLDQFLQRPLGLIDGPPASGLLPTARVVNKTGVEGEYDVHLQYQWQLGAGAGQHDGAATDPALEAEPTLFVALQQQLGLKLEKSKQPFDVLVVDRVEKTPTEN
jgi:uncharacterized protein (TIGR03435 family)